MEPYRHIARHLEQVALFSVPRADYGDDDEVLNDNAGSLSHENAKWSVFSPGSKSDSDDESEVISSEPFATTEHYEPEEDGAAVLELEKQMDVPESGDALWNRISTKYYDASATDSVRYSANTRWLIEQQLGNATGPVTRSFYGWGFRKDSNPDAEASWAHARRVTLPYSPDELLRIVSKGTKSSAVSEQYNSLRSPHQRALVDGLLETMKSEERNPNAEWNLACIEQDEVEYFRKGLQMVKEVREIRVVLRRSPRRGVLIGRSDGAAATSATGLFGFGRAHGTTGGGADAHDGDDEGGETASDPDF
ncbi:hypothetical protein SLS54_003823 [Diplodia seriata]